MVVFGGHDGKKLEKLQKKNKVDTSGIEPDTSRMLSERDKPSTPCARATLFYCSYLDRRWGTDNPHHLFRL
jgi:hypothetical protein